MRRSTKVKADMAAVLTSFRTNQVLLETLVDAICCSSSSPTDRQYCAVDSITASSPLALVTRFRICCKRRTEGSRRTVISKISVGNVGDVIHPPVASEGDGKAVLSTALEGFILPTPVETI